MDYSWAKPGVKCICVDADPMHATIPAREWGRGEAPVRGHVYTIRDIWDDPISGETVVALFEIERSAHAREYWGRAVGYALKRFRPLVTRSQQHDIALFAPLLNTRELAQ